jgi:hypothetical protein
LTDAGVNLLSDSRILLSLAIRTTPSHNNLQSYS